MNNNLEHNIILDIKALFRSLLYLIYINADVIDCVEQVFPPQFRELPPPSLDLFDLDEQFSSEKARLAQITNKCKSQQCESPCTPNAL